MANLRLYSKKSLKEGVKFINMIFIHRIISELQKSSTEGFSAGLVDDSDLFKWDVMIIGPYETF